MSLAQGVLLTEIERLKRVLEETQVARKHSQDNIAAADAQILECEKRVAELEFEVNRKAAQSDKTTEAALIMMVQEAERIMQMTILNCPGFPKSCAEHCKRKIEDCDTAQANAWLQTYKQWNQGRLPVAPIIENDCSANLKKWEISEINNFAERFRGLSITNPDTVRAVRAMLEVVGATLP
jgi:hypothetical protein